MPIPSEIIKCYNLIDSNTKNFIEDLKYLASIANVSSDQGATKELSKAIKWMSTRLKDLGFSITLTTIDDIPYKGNKPNIILGTLGDDPNKITLLYYCHLDVLKVEKNQWKTDPFQLKEVNGRFYGRGVAKMKGPLLCFLNAIQTFKDLNISLPVNFKVICESLNECKSKGLAKVLALIKSNFLVNVDCVLINESHWLGKNYPCIVYGMRGVVYFNLKISGPQNDLNSGDFGGIIREPMNDFLHLMNEFVDPFGKIKVPNFYNEVVQVTPDEEAFYTKIKCNVAEYKETVGVNKLGHGENLKLALMHVWRYPWFALHDVFNENDNHNSMNISKSVCARFSIRTVPKQTTADVTRVTIDYIQKAFANMKTPNKLSITAQNPLDPWYENHLHWNYEAANLATKQVYKVEASFIREGNGFPIVLILHDAMPDKNILILPIVDSGSQAHSDSENISLRCFIEGTKLMVSYFYNLNMTAKKAKKFNKTWEQNICRNKM